MKSTQNLQGDTAIVLSAQARCAVRLRAGAQAHWP